MEGASSVPWCWLWDRGGVSKRGWPPKIVSRGPLRRGMSTMGIQLFILLITLMLCIYQYLKTICPIPWIAPRKTGRTPYPRGYDLLYHTYEYGTRYGTHYAQSYDTYTVKGRRLFMRVRTEGSSMFVSTATTGLAHLGRDDKIALGDICESSREWKAFTGEHIISPQKHRRPSLFRTSTTIVRCSMTKKIVHVNFS